MKTKEKKINLKKKKKKKKLSPKKIMTPKNYNKIKFETKFTKKDNVNLYDKLKNNKRFNSSKNITKKIKKNNPLQNIASINYFNTSNFTSQKNSIIKESGLNSSKNIFSTKFINSPKNLNSNTLFNKSSLNLRSRSLINTTKLKSNTFIDSIFSKKNKGISKKNSLILIDNKKEEINYQSNYLEKNPNVILDNYQSNYLKKNYNIFLNKNKNNKSNKDKSNFLENNQGNKYLEKIKISYLNKDSNLINNSKEDDKKNNNRISYENNNYSSQNNENIFHIPSTDEVFQSKLLTKNQNQNNDSKNKNKKNYLRLNNYNYDKTELNVQLSKTENTLYKPKNDKIENFERNKSLQKNRKDILSENKTIYSGSRRYTDIPRMKEKSLNRDTSMSKFKYVVVNGKLIKKDLTEEDINFHSKNLGKSHSSLINRNSGVFLAKKKNSNFSKEKILKNEIDKNKFVFTNNYVKFDDEKKTNFNSHINKESEDFMEFTKNNIRVVSSRDLKSYILRDKIDENNKKDEFNPSSKNSYSRSQNMFGSINFEDDNIIYNSKKFVNK